MDIEQHRLRAESIDEIHARPFDPVPVGARILHYGFSTGPEDRSKAAKFHRGLAAVATSGHEEEALRLTRFEIDGVAVRWEQHTEFATLTAILPSSEGSPKIELLPSQLQTLLTGPPGPVLVACELEVVRDMPSGPSRFDEASLCDSRVRDGTARVQTDFRLGLGGYTRFLLIADDLDARAVGIISRQLLEVETYRTFAMLGLPVARRLSRTLTGIETALADATKTMSNQHGQGDNQALLEKLTSQAAMLEAQASETSFRFAATAAYNDILLERLKVLGEVRTGGHPTMADFLQRRVSPAIRTCQATTDRISELSRRLTRAANLLRTRVDIELEQQNQSVLRSMDRRARLQLRLQQTVEGLSVAAVSYYIVGLVGYLAKSAKAAGLPINSEVATGISVPIVIGFVWWMVRSIRRGHSE